MALRVLLADESSTIKKVIQLALQDFGVQVKTINVGADALDIARDFAPDIVFADVLLQKKSGYDVCQEIKKDPSLHRTPVILMWSGFLELDDQQFKESRADDQLEKPFNVETLRTLIRKWVPKTGGQALSQFIELAPQPAPPAEPKPAPAPQTIAAKPNLWEANQFEDIVDFAQDLEQEPPLEVVKPYRSPSSSPSPSPSSSPPATDKEEAWMSQDLTRFKLTIPEDEDDEDAPIALAQTKSSVIRVDDDDELGHDFGAVNYDEYQAITSGPQLTAQIEAKKNEAKKSGDKANKAVSSQSSGSGAQVNPEQMEAIVRAQSLEVIEAMVQKIVPDLAQRLIREELDRLLREDAPG